MNMNEAEGKGFAALLKNTTRHSAAFFFAPNIGKIFFRQPGEEYILEQGTITFIEYRGNYYGITNQHVIGENWKQRIDVEKESLMIALNSHQFWFTEPIFVSPPIEKQGVLYSPHLPKDIVVYPCSNQIERLAKSNKVPIELPESIPHINEGWQETCPKRESICEKELFVFAGRSF